jgi:2-dehydro-3-deoxyphosphogluconate aldolase/(4S)-4-hydroxy-2-oxoglutarate aldolase
VLRASPVIAVVTLGDADAAEHAARALVAGGVPWVEVTFRTPGAAGALRRVAGVAGAVPGAGTIREVHQADLAAGAGAQFLVSPGFSPLVAKWARSNGVLWLPGVDSTLGVEAALAEGLRTLKCFPAGLVGGPAWLRAMAGPYPDVGFVPTGGVTMATLGDYLREPNVVAAAGSFLVPPDAADAGDWGAVTALAREAAGIAREAKGL